MISAPGGISVCAAVVFATKDSLAKVKAEWVKPVEIYALRVHHSQFPSGNHHHSLADIDILKSSLRLMKYSFHSEVSC